MQLNELIRNERWIIIRTKKGAVRLPSVVPLRFVKNRSPCALVHQHSFAASRSGFIGSVKIVVDSVVQRQFDPVTMEYTEIEDNTDYCADVPFDMEAQYFIDYMHMTDFNYLSGCTVQYPEGDDGKGTLTSKGTLTWFKGNHNDGQMVKPGYSCSIAYPLPRLTDDPKDLVLPALIYDEEEKQGVQTDSGGNQRKQIRDQVPTTFESTSASKPQYENRRCKATKKCKGIVPVKISVPFPKKQMVVCPVCKKEFEVKV